MFYVPFVCPKCQHSTEAPLTGVADGDAGVWACDECGRAYQIQIEFSEVRVPCPSLPRSLPYLCNPAVQRN